jgi:hypothetical protein
MHLQGSCACGAVRFRVSSREPYPFNQCYCGLCRKTAGSGGYAINLKGDTDTLVVEGRDRVRVFRARIRNPEDAHAALSPARRHFCGECGTPLWVWDPRWPEMLHPYAGAIDTPLPVPPERTHLMLDFKPAWVEPCIGARDRQHPRYPQESIEDWHARLGLFRD